MPSRTLGSSRRAAVRFARGLHYIAPSELARTLARHQATGDVPILDVGCGTGLTGCCLKAIGFSTIDGLDFSTAMLSKAQDKGVYRTLIEADLNAPLALGDGVYGAAISSGTFTPSLQTADGSL